MPSRNDVLKFAKRRYGTEPDYPWTFHPGYAVLRHTEDRKWYCLVMNVPRAKLGLTGDGEVDILDIKSAPALIGSLRLSAGFLPAYHMNKEHWVSVLLDGSVPKREIEALISQSYDMTRLPRAM